MDKGLKGVGALEGHFSSISIGDLEMLDATQEQGKNTKKRGTVRKDYSGRSSNFLSDETKAIRQRISEESALNAVPAVKTEAIFSPEHSGTSVLKASPSFQNSINSSNSMDESGDRKPRFWTEYEDQGLKRAVKMYGEKDWKKIAELVPGRSSTQCIQRWKKVLKPGLKKGHWSPAEDELLQKGVQIQLDIARQMRKTDVKLDWSKVATQIPKRSCKQCRERWVNHLDPDINKGEWTVEEDDLLWRLNQVSPKKWAQIARQIPGRTENQVKVRCNILAKRRKLTDTKNPPIQPTKIGFPEASAINKPTGRQGKKAEPKAGKPPRHSSGAKKSSKEMVFHDFPFHEGLEGLDASEVAAASFLSSRAASRAVADAGVQKSEPYERSDSKLSMSAILQPSLNSLGLGSSNYPSQEHSSLSSFIDSMNGLSGSTSSFKALCAVGLGDSHRELSNFNLGSSMTSIGSSASGRDLFRGNHNFRSSFDFGMSPLGPSSATAQFTAAATNAATNNNLSSPQVGAMPTQQSLKDILRMDPGMFFPSDITTSAEKTAQTLLAESCT